MTNYEKCTLLSVEYKTTSYYGNPSYYIAFLDSKGNYKRGYTSSNASSGYTASNYKYSTNAPIFLEYHETRAGNLIVDRIKHNTPEQAKQEAEKCVK